MRWQLMWGILILLLLASSAPGIRSHAAPPPTPEHSLTEQIQHDGRARVLVELAVPVQAEAQLAGAEAVAQQRAAIQQAQDTVLSRLTLLSAAPARRLHYAPILALDVDLPTLEALRRDPLVVSVTEDTLLLPQLAGSGTLIGVPAMREQGFSGAGWAVAVLDTGIESSHPFLGGNVIAEACFSTTYAPQHITSLCAGGQTTDYGPGAAANCTSTAAEDGGGMAYCGHGTHVAGIATGSDDTSSGVAPDADIIAIQVFSKQRADDGSSRIVAYSSDVLAALEHVYTLRDTHRIAAVNLSLATATHYTSTTACQQYSAYNAARSIVDHLRAAGIATIAATGNGAHTDGINAPACLDNVISVGATTATDEIWSGSNSAAFVDLLAPGAGIRSAFPVHGFPNYGDFVQFSGTSQAAAQVSGAWTVLKAAEPGASVGQIYDALRVSGPPLRDPRNGVELPRLKLDAALAALQATIGDAPPAMPLDLRASIESPASVRLTWHDTSTSETAFVIERSTDGLAWEQHAHLAPNSTSYLDSDLNCATRYSYRVRAQNAAAASLPTTAASITTIACAPGDCNRDTRLDAGDLAALNGALGAPASSSPSCDADGDSQISRADIACTLRRIFGIPCDDTHAFASAIAAAPGNPASGTTTRSDLPVLALPQHIEARANQTITVPLTFRAGAEPISSVAFALHYDHERLHFAADTAHGISFATLPTGFQGYLAFDNADPTGTIKIAVLAATQADALPDGTTLAVLTFAVRNTATDATTPLGFAAEPGTSFGTLAGQSSIGSSSTGSIQIRAATQPALSIPTQMRAATPDSVNVPVVLAPNGVPVTEATFCLRYNATWLTPAATGDLLRLPAGLRGSLIASGPASVCLTVETEDAAPLVAGELARVQFGLHNALPAAGVRLLHLDAAQPISFTNRAGQPQAGDIDGTSLSGVQVFAALHRLYLPAVSTS